jgi:hypothetical protein
LEDVVVALMTPTDQYLCQELHRAMDGIGTEKLIVLMDQLKLNI